MKKTLLIIACVAMASYATTTEKFDKNYTTAVANFCLNGRYKPTQYDIIRLIRSVDTNDWPEVCDRGTQMVTVFTNCPPSQYVYNTNQFAKTCYIATNCFGASTIPIRHPSSEQARDVLPLVNDTWSFEIAPFKGNQNDFRLYDDKSRPYIEPRGYDGQTTSR